MKTENEMNNNGQRTPAAGNGTRKPNFRHKNYRYKAQPKKEGKDGQKQGQDKQTKGCLLYTSPSPRDAHESRMPSSA